jgi:hypothetical protein
MHLESKMRSKINIYYISHIYIIFNAFLIEPTPPSHDDKWNQLYARAEQEAEKERAQNQNVPLKKPSTIEILQTNLDKFQHTIEW